MVFTVANRYPSWAAEAEAKYIRQIHSFDVIVNMLRPSTSVDKEGMMLLSKMSKNSYRILLDVTGKEMDSSEFAISLQQWLQALSSPVFIIGGACGVSQNFYNVVDFRLSLSPLTFSHTLTRLVLMEQLFRADCIFRNHPYPR